MKEVQLGRYAGPYEYPPFDTFIQLPIGLVPKDKGTKTRLIFHLSYPRDGSETSVNVGIPKDKWKVKYPDFMDAVRMCLNKGRFAKIGKSDMTAAFRQVPVRVLDCRLLILKAEHPISKKICYYVDLCLPFGSSISCAIFQAISDCIAHIVSWKMKKTNLNYLDDYFFMGLLKALCDGQVSEFLQVCSYINFPVSLDKTFWGTTLMTFLGFLLDMVNQLVCIPADKVEKAMVLIDKFLIKKKATVKEIERLTGFLNFLCRCVVPGHAFTRRFYTLTHRVKLKPHHHVMLRLENRLDLEMWKQFLGGLSLHLNHLIAERVSAPHRQFGTLPIGIFCQIWTQDSLRHLL